MKESESLSCLQSFLRSSVCPHPPPPQQWIYSWRWALYVSRCPRGSGDILQPSHVPHKNCQWVRSEDFSKTTEALMHSNMLHYNDISYQQYERERLTQKDGGGGVIKCLPLPNRQLSCQSHKSNQRLIAPLSLPHSSAASSPPLLFLFKAPPPHTPSYVFANTWRATMRCMHPF